jgi:NDP-sugar pyrophosphorylase family protein
MATLPTLTGRRRCIPVVDDLGRPTHVVSDAPESLGMDTAVVMAGGFGKRQGSRTAVTPKPLLPVAGRPVLWHVLKHLEEHGLKRIFITIHHLGEQIRDFVRNSDFRAQIEFIEEPEPLGTAGGLGRLPKSLTGPLLVMNADIVTRADFASMLTHHRTHRHDLTIGATRYDLEIPFGVLKVGEDGLLSDIDEKPHFRNVVSAGIYLIDSQLIGDLDGQHPYDMPDLIRGAMAAGQRVGIFPIHEYWLDLARPADLVQAEEDRLHWLR